MKTKYFFKNSQKAMAAFVFAASMSLTFTACSDEIEQSVEEAPVENKLPILGADADTYNINDAKDCFSAKDWREQSAIYLYDGQGSERDTENRKGYVKVNLPWNTGDVLSNLPNGFCNDITPAGNPSTASHSCTRRLTQSCPTPTTCPSAMPMQPTKASSSRYGTTHSLQPITLTAASPSSST